MALQIVWTRDAEDHLKEILLYWHHRNRSPAYSQKLFQTVKNALNILAKYPDTGKLTENSRIKAKIIKDYFLFFSIDNEQLVVLGFCDVRRDPEYIETLLK